jgi:hypothetical protein
MSEQPYTTTPAEERYWNRYRLVQTLQSIAALWAAMALLGFVMGASGFLRSLSQTDWPSVPGVVIVSEVVSVIIPSPASRREEAVQIVYEYQVEDTAYNSDQVNLNPVPIQAGSDEGQRLLATYPVGTAVTVYHDPADPAEAVLEREPSPEGFIAGASLAGMAAMVWLLGFVLGRELRRKPANEPNGPHLPH